MGMCLGKKKGKGKAEAAGAGKGGAGDFFGKMGKKRKKSDEMTAAHHVTNKEDFTNQLKAAGEKKLIVVDFYATWCGPCKMVKPRVEEMAEQMKAQNVEFLAVDVDECEDVCSDYGISSMPTFVLIKNSEKVDEMSGVNMSRLKELIENNK